MNDLFDKTFDAVINVMDRVADTLDKAWDVLTHKHKPKF